MPKANATYYLDPGVVSLIDELAAALSCPRSAVVALAVQELAASRGVPEKVSQRIMVEAVAAHALEIMR